MSEDTPARRSEDGTVDQNLRFTTTIGWGISMILIVAAAVRMYGVIDNRLSDVETFSTRTRTRQDTYILRDAATHESMDVGMEDMHHDMSTLREYLILKFGESLPHE